MFFNAQNKIQKYNCQNSLIGYNNVLLKITNEIKSSGRYNKHSNFQLIIILNSFKIAMISVGDKITGFANTTMVCCLRSELK